MSLKESCLRPSSLAHLICSRVFFSWIGSIFYVDLVDIVQKLQFWLICQKDILPAVTAILLLPWIPHWCDRMYFNLRVHLLSLLDTSRDVSSCRHRDLKLLEDGNTAFSFNTWLLPQQLSVVHVSFFMFFWWPLWAFHLLNEGYQQFCPCVKSSNISSIYF